MGAFALVIALCAAEMASPDRELRPHEGQQEKFLATSADIAIYGGEAGGGKTWALVFEAARWTDLPEYRAVAFRRTAPELVGGGGLWDEARKLYPLFGGKPRESPNLDWAFPSGARIEMRHLQHENDVHAHQGRQYALVLFDELTHFTERQFWYLVSRNRSTCGVRPYIRASCNPGPDSFVRRLIAWWIGDDGLPISERDGVLRWFARDGDELLWGDSPEEMRAQHAAFFAANPGVEPLSLTFVHAGLEDNPTLMRADPGYRARLLVLPRVERLRLAEGNWDVRPAAGQYFRRSWFETVDCVPGRVVQTVRFWDKAATEPHPGNTDPDWTVGAKVSRLDDGRFIIEHLERFRATPGGVREGMRRLATSDGVRVAVGLWQDPGQAGVVDVEATVRELVGYRTKRVKAASDKLTYAEVWSPLVEHHQVLVLAGSWNETFFGEAEAFPDGTHDDQIDAVSGAFQLLSAGGHRLKAAIDAARERGELAKAG